MGFFWSLEELPGKALPVGLDGTTLSGPESWPGTHKQTVVINERGPEAGGVQRGLLHRIASSPCQGWRPGSSTASPTPLSFALHCGAGLVLFNLFINDL